MSEKCKLILEGNEYEFPVTVGSENEKAIDISKLRATTGYITLDSGFKNTGSTKSQITFLNGEKGILRYRGYPIEQLANESSFLEVAYLLRLFLGHHGVWGQAQRGHGQNQKVQNPQLQLEEGMAVHSLPRRSLEANWRQEREPSVEGVHDLPVQREEASKTKERSVGVYRR